MRIVHVIGRLNARDGGPPHACLAMSRALARRGHAVHILTTWGSLESQPDSHAPKGTVFSDLPPDFGQVHICQSRVRPPYRWLWAPQMRNHFKRILPSIDLVVIDSLYLWHSKTIPALCRRFGVPYIVRPHGSLSPYILSKRRWIKAVLMGWFQRKALRSASGIFFTIEGERDLAPSWVPRTTAFVCPLGVDPPPPPLTRTKQPPDTGPTLLYLGRLHEKKGLDLILSALALLTDTTDGSARLPNARVVLAGPDDGMRGRLLAQIASLGLDPDRVTFTGTVSGLAKDRVFQDADLFVLPSSQENFAISMVEAMAHGLPVLVSADVETAPMVAKADAGRIIARTPEAIADAVVTLWSDPARRESMGMAGRALVEASLTWDAVAARLEAIYSGIIAVAASRRTRPASGETDSIHAD